MFCLTGSQGARGHLLEIGEKENENRERNLSNWIWNTQIRRDGEK